MSEIEHASLAVNQCPEFPFFGAWYPDATCIDGYLWDLDSSEDDGCLHVGGDIACPFCNLEQFIEQYEDVEEYTRESLLEYIQTLKSKYGQKIINCL